jgi:hypothetical protein
VNCQTEEDRPQDGARVAVGNNGVVERVLDQCLLVMHIDQSDREVAYGGPIGPSLSIVQVALPIEITEPVGLPSRKLTSGDFDSATAALVLQPQRQLLIGEALRLKAPLLIDAAGYRQCQLSIVGVLARQNLVFVAPPPSANALFPIDKGLMRKLKGELTASFWKQELCRPTESVAECTAK